MGIDNARQVVGNSIVGGVEYAVEWSGGSVIILGLGQAYGINDLGQVVGTSTFFIPESSTWAMMLLGFAGFALAGIAVQKQARQLSR